MGHWRRQNGNPSPNWWQLVEGQAMWHPFWVVRVFHPKLPRPVSRFKWESTISRFQSAKSIWVGFSTISHMWKQLVCVIDYAQHLKKSRSMWSHYVVAKGLHLSIWSEPHRGDDVASTPANHAAQSESPPSSNRPWAFRKPATTWPVGWCEISSSVPILTKWNFNDSKHLGISN